jgi:predicted O-methyltransferase YrrM
MTVAWFGEHAVKSRTEKADMESLWQAIERARANAREEDLAWVGTLPPSDGWMLAPDALRLLMRLVEVLQPRHILEFGSGLSTRALARACGRLLGPRAVSSVDHDPDFGPLAARDYAQAAAPANVRVRFQVAPVVARDCGGQLLPVYRWRPAAFASRRPLDLVVIDGPATILGGREGTLYQAMDYARPGTVMVLDDAGRPEERAAVARWRETLGSAIESQYFPEFAKGLTVIVVREPVPRARLWAYQQAQCGRDLEKVVPPGARYIQPDHGSWDHAMLAGRHCLPALAYPPANEAEVCAAIAAAAPEADFLVLLWPSFWWQDTYPALFNYLRRRFPLTLSNTRMQVYDLRCRPQAATGAKP